MSKKKYTVLIFPKAEHDLYEIKEYFEQVLKASPHSLFKKFSESIDFLEENPMIFPRVKDTYLNQLGYHMIPIDNFLLFYIIVNQEVQIHRFIYGKRNYLQIL